MNDEEKLAVLEERVRNWMESTSEYRKVLCEKLEDLKQTNKDVVFVLSKLPCNERKAWYSSMNRQLLFMWGVMALVIGLLFKSQVDEGNIKKAISTLRTGQVAEAKSMENYREENNR